MRNVIKIVCILTIAIALIIIAHFSTAKAQEGAYTMPWSAFSAGGRAVSVAAPIGDYDFRTTFGQPVAGLVSNGQLTLTSGFLGWLDLQLLSNEIYFPLIQK